MFTKPCPWYLANPGFLAAVGPTARTADVVYAHEVYLNEPAQLTAFSIPHGGVSAGNIDMGIFDASGNLLAHTGITSVAGFVNLPQTINLVSPLPLSAGRYLFGVWLDNSTDTYFAIPGLNQAWANLLNTNVNPTTGLASFSALGGSKPGAVFFPFLGHLAGTGF